jgi:hypothetical protein
MKEFRGGIEIVVFDLTTLSLNLVSTIKFGRTLDRLIARAAKKPLVCRYEDEGNFRSC